MKQKPTVRDRYRYWFDGIMSRGASTLIVWLFLCATSVIVFLASLQYLFRFPDEASPTATWVDVLWTTFMHTLDSGAISGDKGHPGFILIMMLATLSGMFLLSTLIGLINAGIDEKISNIRRGRSRVLESGHTVILGWSPHVITILQELIIANESEKRACVAILADKDKLEMEEEIRANILDSKTTKIVCRTGNPIDQMDIAIVSPDTSKSIIIPPPETDHPDISVIKMVLAIVNNRVRRSEPYRIVASIESSENIEVAEIAGGTEVKYVLSDDLISRIMAQACRQSGLSIVYSELLDFEGCEIYFYGCPQLVGKTYNESLLAFESTTVIGLFSPELGVRINPVASTIITPSELLIVIAEDDSKITYTNATYSSESVPVKRTHDAQEAPERFLFIQWNSKGKKILMELDRYVHKGSEIHIVVSDIGQSQRIVEEVGTLENLEIISTVSEPTRKLSLQAVDPCSFNHIIILSPEDIPQVQEADAKTLAVLLILRDLLKSTANNITIVSEMQDVQNRQLAEVAKADDFIVSSRLDSLLMTQISENVHLYDVFQELFDADGSEIYLKPMEEYFESEVTLSYSSLVRICAERGQTVIGYRNLKYAQDRNRQYGVVINPSKSAKVFLSKTDKIIVVSES